MENLAEELDRKLDEKLSTLKQEIIESVVSIVNKRLDIIQQQCEESVNAINARIDRMDDNVKVAIKQDVTLILKNFPLCQDESNEFLQLQVNEMFKELSIGNIVPTSVERMAPPQRDNRNRGDGSRPPLVQLVMASKSHWQSVLRAKRVLVNTEAYKEVFIEPYRTHSERKLSTNIRQIVRASPNLSFNRGKIVNNH